MSEMDIASSLKTLALGLERKNNSVFTYSVEKQKAYVKHFREPKDDIERSYNQYCCQMKFNNPLLNGVTNLAAFPLLLLHLKKRNDVGIPQDFCDAIFFADGKPENIIPNELRSSLSRIVVVGAKKESFSDFDWIFFKHLWSRYPFSWLFLLKCLLKIRYYSYEIQRCHPKAIVVCNEYSFTSSVMTAYCKTRNIKHINVMHGEKLYFIRDSFFRFDRCFIWNEYYRDLFCELRAERSQFKIAIPSSLQFKLDEPIVKKYDFTYYLGAESDEVLKRILESLNIMSQKGYRVALRPHPRYSDIQEIRRLCDGVITVEDGNGITIEESVLRSRNAISGYSTVLNQAYNNGVGVVLDDVSNPKAFRKLEELGYIMLKVKHELLSHVLEEIR